MTATNNNVIVLPDPTISEWNGVLVTGSTEQQRFRSVTGTVLSVPKLRHHGELLRSIGKDRPAHMLRRIREINAVTLPELQPDILKAGDRVLFQYMAHNSPKDGEAIVMPYTMLIARFPEMTMLNGFLAVRFEEKENYTYDSNDYSIATVVHDGPITTQLDGSTDDPIIKIDSKVVFDRRFAARLEVDEFNSLNKGMQSSLFKVHRKNVNAYVID